MSFLNRSLVGLVTMVVFAVSAPAEEALTPPAQLKAMASHVIVGTIERVTSEVVPNEAEGFGNTDVRFETRIAVVSVEKGAGLAAGEVIVVHACLPNTVDVMARVRAGTRRIPAVGERARVYLKQRDGGYDLVSRDGFTPAGSAPLKEHAGATWYRWTGHLSTIYGVPVLGVGLGVAAFAAMMLLDRMRRKKR